MNLREFLDYRPNCLCCGSKLNVSFHSSKKQSYRLENNRFVATFDLKGIKKGQKSYKFAYSIDLEDNSFFIEFYNNDGVHWFNNYVPTWLLDRYQKLDQNHGKYRFQKYCNICQKYNYTSNIFALNYKSLIIDDLKINVEVIGSYKKSNDSGSYNVYDVVNYYDINETWYSVHKCPEGGICQYKSEHVIKVSMIAISTIDNLTNRIDKLMVFS